MLVCYLDDSGTGKESPIIALGGYISFLPAWLAFEQAAQLILDRYHVANLHAEAFQSTKEDFVGWSRAKKETFIEELFKCVNEHILFGVTFGVLKSAYLLRRKQRLTRANES